MPPVTETVVETHVEILGRRDYQAVWRAMRDYTSARTPGAPDRLWVTEHPPVYTLGRNGRGENVAGNAGVPVVHTDRGGRATYHGPGQAVLYTLVDLRRRGFGVRRFVRLLEETVIGLLGEHGIAANTRPGAPGVYARGRKIASLGLCVSGGRCYHGLALNVDMELHPFERIAVCGEPALEVTQMKDLGAGGGPDGVGIALAQRLAGALNP